jgi:hypothetical protein
MGRHRWLLGAGVAVFTLGLPAPPAYAQTPTERADADELSVAAAALVKKGLFAHACAKYEASARLDPSARRFMTLADCQERAGMIARAWMSFGDAQEWAQSRGDTVLAAAARDQAKRLDAKLGRIEITVPLDNEIEGLQIRHDGALVAPAARGVPIPVDPGLHVVSATAPGRRPWSTTIGLSPGKMTISVVVPFLDEDVESASAPSPDASSPTTLPSYEQDPLRSPPEPLRLDDRDAGRWQRPTSRTLPPSPMRHSEFDPDRGSTQRTVGWVLGGAGIAGIAAGTVFAVQALSSRSSLAGSCGSPAFCEVALRDELETQRAQAMAANILLSTGIVSLAGGVIVYLTAPSPQRAERAATALQVAPSFGPGTAGLLATGRF